MANRRTGATAGRKRRGRMSLLWSAAAGALVIALIWTEQVALLYVLATLSVAGLLIIVAFSDLGGARRLVQTPPGDDSAAAGDAMNAASATTTAAARAGRR